MDNRMLITFCSILTVILLSSCTTMTQGDQRKAVCNEIKSKMTFNGSTSNFSKANVENSEAAFLQRQYIQNHCDEV